MDITCVGRVGLRGVWESSHHTHPNLFGLYLPPTHPPPYPTFLAYTVPAAPHWIIH